MNWEVIGVISETVGAVAVVATLAYLAVQIRASNRAAKNTLTQELQDTMKIVFYKNHDEAELFLKAAKDFDSLSEVEVLKFRQLLEVSILDHQRIYNLAKAGEIDEWILFTTDRYLEDLVQMPGVRRWFEKHGSLIHPEFREVLAAKIQENVSKPSSHIRNEQY
ncbi:MAG: hypothetical protein V7744_20845 [Pseudomonadales bacterium]